MFHLFKVYSWFIKIRANIYLIKVGKPGLKSYKTANIYLDFLICFIY